MRKAVLSLLEEDFSTVEEILTSLVKADSDEVESYLALARLYQRRGEIGRAIRIHQNLLLRQELSKDHRLMALAALAEDFRKGGFLNRALATYREVLHEDARHPEALRQLVAIQVDARDFESALSHHKKLASVLGKAPGPGQAEILASMGETCLAAGQPDEALKAFKRALRKDRGNLRSLVGVGEAHWSKGREKRAMASWKKAVEAHRSTAAGVLPRLHQAYSQKEGLGEFEEFLGRLLEKEGDPRDVRLALARCLVARGEFQEAADQVRQVLARAPNDVLAHAALGRTLLAGPSEGEVAKAYDELLDVLERTHPPGSSPSREEAP